MKIPNILIKPPKNKDFNKDRKLNKKPTKNGSLIWINFKNEESFGDMTIQTMYEMDEDGY